MLKSHQFFLQLKLLKLLSDFFRLKEVVSDFDSGLKLSLLVRFSKVIIKLLILWILKSWKKLLIFWCLPWQSWGVELIHNLHSFAFFLIICVLCIIQNFRRFAGVWIPIMTLTILAYGILVSLPLFFWGLCQRFAWMIWMKGCVSIELVIRIWSR